MSLLKTFLENSRVGQLKYVFTLFLAGLWLNSCEPIPSAQDSRVSEKQTGEDGVISTESDHQQGFESDQGGNGESIDNLQPSVDLTGALAIGITDDSLVGSNMVKYDALGSIEPVGNFDATSVSPFSGSLAIEIRQESTFSVTGSRYYLFAKPGQALQQLKTQATILGENSSQHLIMSDISIYDYENNELTPLATTLSSPQITYISGNFLVIRDSENSMAQVYDTLTKKRYNIGDCNGPKAYQLTHAKVFIDDCAENRILDFADGTRTNLSRTSWWPNHEVVLVDNGIVALAQGCIESDSNKSLDYGLCHVDPDGVVTELSTETFQVGGGGTNGNDNKVIYVVGEYIIVKELNAISLVERHTGVKSQILQDVNVTSISITDQQIFYVAENVYGEQVVGRYDLHGNGDNQSTTNRKIKEFRALKQEY